MFLRCVRFKRSLLTLFRMNKPQLFFSVFFCFLLLVEAKGQTDRPEDPRRYIDTAVNYSEIGEYVRADEYFNKALQEIEVLPADFCFHFGKNSYYMNKFSQSIDWLNKYLELKGSQGQYSRATLDILEKAENAFRQSSNGPETKNVTVSDKFFYLNTINCKEDSLITCPVCKGDDVLVKKGTFGELLYQTCPYSTNGVLTCLEFNLLIQGNLPVKHKH